MEHGARPEHLANAARFVELHGDTWEIDFPVARGGQTAVAVRMMYGEHCPPGEDPGSWEVFLQLSAAAFGIIVGWNRITDCPDEFTGAFIRRVVEIVRERQAEGSHITDGQPGEADGDRALEANPNVGTPANRHFREVSFGSQYKINWEPPDTETPPEGPNQDSPPSGA